MDEASFAEHPCWQVLQAIEDELQATETAAASADADHRQRMRFIASYLRSYQDIDSQYFTADMLNAIRPHLDNALTSLRTHPNNPGGGYLGQAVQQIDNIVPTLAAWPQRAARGGAARQAQKVADEMTRNANEILDAMRTKYDDLVQDIENSRVTTDSSIEDFSSKLRSLEERILAGDQKVTADEQRLDAHLTTSNESFLASQNQWNAKFNEWLDVQEAELDSKVVDVFARFEEKHEEADQTLESLESIKVAAERLSGKASASILGGKYDSYALRDWIAGVVSYILGFGTLAGIAIFLLDTISTVTASTDLSWQYVVLKLGLTVTGITAAAVAFRLGSRLLSRSHASKRAALELGAIGPFLSDVDDPEMVRQAKIEFVARMFGKAWDGDGSHQSINGQSNDLPSVTDAYNTIRSIVEKQNGSSAK